MKLFNFQTKKQEKPQNVKEIVCTIGGMHCTSCALNIDGALEDEEGVISAETNYARSVTTVSFDDTRIDSKKIQKIIEDQGYQVLSI